MSFRSAFVPHYVYKEKAVPAVRIWLGSSTVAQKYFLTFRADPAVSVARILQSELGPATGGCTHGLGRHVLAGSGDPTDRNSNLSCHILGLCRQGDPLVF